jgi:hypothetical protein
MPAVSQKQQRFMQAVAHNSTFAKKAGVPQSVGREFSGGDPLNKKLPVAKKSGRAVPKPHPDGSPFRRG